MSVKVKRSVQIAEDQAKRQDIANEMSKVQRDRWREAGYPSAIPTMLRFLHLKVAEEVEEPVRDKHRVCN